MNTYGFVLAGYSVDAYNYFQFVVINLRSVSEKTIFVPTISCKCSIYSTKLSHFYSVYPSFTNTPSNVTVKTGQSAQLLCEATGYPQPLLSWSKDGGKYFPAARDRRFQVNPNNLNEFIIKSVQWADRGVYYCNATNMAGSIITNATVNVLGG